MGTLQTEIFNKVLPKMKTLETLTFDDGGSPLTTEPISKTQKIWEFVHSNPQVTRKQVMKGVPDIKEADVSSFLSQMTKAGRLVRVLVDDTFQYATPAGMTAFPRGSEFRLQSIKKALAARTAASKKPKSEPTKTRTFVRRTVELDDAKAYVETLNVKQARELYAALKEVFSL